ncbi:unnamed protein product [Gadus morhua 'NCC']
MRSSVEKQRLLSHLPPLLQCLTVSLAYLGGFQPMQKQCLTHRARLNTPDLTAQACDTGLGGVPQGARGGECMETLDPAAWELQEPSKTNQGSEQVVGPAFEAYTVYRKTVQSFAPLLAAPRDDALKCVTKQ